MIEFKNHIWAEINLDAIKNNLQEAKKLAGNSKIIAVVKANAYGHGATEIAKALIDSDVEFLAVSSLREALELRQNGIKCKILILGYSSPKNAEILANNNISQTIYSPEHAAEFAEELALCGKKLNAHI